MPPPTLLQVQAGSTVGTRTQGMKAAVSRARTQLALINPICLQVCHEIRCRAAEALPHVCDLCCNVGRGINPCKQRGMPAVGMSAGKALGAVWHTCWRALLQQPVQARPHLPTHRLINMQQPFVPQLRLACHVQSSTGTSGKQDLQAGKQDT